MKPIVRVVLAVLAGVAVGSVVNMGLVMAGGAAIPPPEGADVSSMEGLKASMPLFEARHFLFPFLAHALGTLAGAFVAARLAAPGKRIGPALAVGCVFLLGGVSVALAAPPPVWFAVLDLGAAYLPAAWVGGRLGARES
ncbi:MAG: hypothetical protein M5U13_13425 [Thermoanaerobaculia bacterium]|nr:hypothetical protein [Thermoanaerobaculia bacterium]